MMRRTEDSKDEPDDLEREREHWRGRALLTSETLAEGRRVG
jgi:hypothetical protein